MTILEMVRQDAREVPPNANFPGGWLVEGSGTPDNGPKVSPYCRYYADTDAGRVYRNKGEGNWEEVGSASALGTITTTIPDLP